VSLNLSLTKQVRRGYQPKKADFMRWIKSSLLSNFIQVNIDIMIVDSKNSAIFNAKYRNKNTATNVIALEYQDSREKFQLLYGEIILCDEVIVNEAIAQHKKINHHYAHMLVHAMLHLQGYDHQHKMQRKHMETLEVEILANYAINNPYQTC
jgi:probable rRNA maturation factor